MDRDSVREWNVTHFSLFFIEIIFVRKSQTSKRILKHSILQLSAQSERLYVRIVSRLRLPIIGANIREIVSDICTNYLLFWCTANVFSILSIFSSRVVDFFYPPCVYVILIDPLRKSHMFLSSFYDRLRMCIVKYIYHVSLSHSMLTSFSFEYSCNYLPTFYIVNFVNCQMSTTRLTLSHTYIAFVFPNSFRSSQSVFSNKMFGTLLLSVHEYILLNYIYVNVFIYCMVSKQNIVHLVWSSSTSVVVSYMYM